MNAQLQKLLSEENAEFHFDGDTWCLSGVENGLSWETDDVEADNIEDAEQQAIDHIEGSRSYHELVELENSILA